MNTDEFWKECEALAKIQKLRMNTDELQEMYETLTKIWENLRETIEKLAEALNNAFGSSGTSTREITSAKRRVRTYDMRSKSCKKVRL